MYEALAVESQSLSVSLLSLVAHKSLSFSLCLCCSCLGDRVRGGRPGQWQSETGGEFTVDTLHVFISVRLFSSCWVWHIHGPAGRHWDTSLYSAWQWKSNFWMEMKREEVRQLRVFYVWIPSSKLNAGVKESSIPLGAGLRSLLINARSEERWCHQKVPGVSLQREQCKGGHVCSSSDTSRLWR